MGKDANPNSHEWLTGGYLRSIILFKHIYFPAYERVEGGDVGDRDGDDAISPADTLDIRAGDGQRGDHQGGRREA